jgi:hypothetical protein
VLGALASCLGLIRDEVLRASGALGLQCFSQLRVMCFILPVYTFVPGITVRSAKSNADSIMRIILSKPSSPFYSSLSPPLYIDCHPPITFLERRTR